MAPKASPHSRSSRPRLFAGALGRSRRAHITGVSVSETKADMTTAAVTVTANSRNSTPTMPPISSNGMNTATSEMVIDTMVKPISPAPLNVACSGVSPFSIWRTMFSIMTMASSTTKPTAMVSAIRVRLLML